ncbi:hypothetical protein [Paracoccus xiamenensis]|uniref:hypothetical protein n=1 Tax=Paracoccus xiamenensis TaxID=2714901 RepID=UPI00140A9AEE|nr:hypothetical protein [Paracoccus xiamenensis]NHF73644.1 hypothetical protein [Paracoccus xiamenensis]
MSKIAPLGVTEPIRVDAGRIQNIVTELGGSAAEGVIQLALEQMASLVEGVLESARQGDDAAVVSQAERLSRLAWQVGLVSLAGVAIDVADCARRHEAVALTATLARAVRVANRSLTEIWDEVSGL